MTSRTDFAPLPDTIGPLGTDTARWWYPAPNFAGREGYARLRVWLTSSGLLAVATDLGEGVSVTNAAEHIWAAITTQWGTTDLAYLEHYRHGRRISQPGNILDQYRPGTGWRPVWPVPPANPRHSQLAAWITRHGPILFGDGWTIEGDPS